MSIQVVTDTSFEKARQLEEGRKETFIMNNPNCFQKTVLVFNGIKNSCSNFSPYLASNLAKVSLTGGLAALGGIFAGDPRISAYVGLKTAIYIGAAGSGIANSLSTYFGWKTNDVDRIKHLEEENQSLKDRLEKIEQKVFRNA